jgi:DNA modification methylase
MPKLDWSSKSQQPLPEGKLVTDLVHYSGPMNGLDSDPENHLILGDNLPVMSALLADYENKIDLIYVDPPFFTNKGYTTRVGRGEDSRKPEEWKLAEGYADEWEDLASYLDMLYPRLQTMHRLLAPTGSLFLHLDWHANSYARVLLDEIFGYDNLRNEIIWTYHGPSPIRSAFNRKHDMILFYSKTDQYYFDVDAVRVPYASNTVDTFKSSSKAGFGKVPDLERGKVPEDWWYFPVVARLHQERTGYPTQKPERLMDRIIRATTKPDDLVADLFCGAGTTGSVAARLGRRFILSDNQSRAIHTTRARLILDQDKSDMMNNNLSPLIVQHEEGIKFDAPKTAADLGYPDPEIQDGSVQLAPQLAEQVLYWEIDPDYKGKIFHSSVSAARPWRKGSLIDKLTLPDLPGRICLRLVMINGELIQQEIK